VSSLRTKLVVLLVLPVAFLVLVAATGFRSAQADFHRARDLPAATDLALTTDQAALALIVERHQTGVGPDDDLATHRSTTDTALAELGDVLDELPPGTAAGDDVAAVRDVAEDLPRRRGEVTEDATAADVQEAYDEAITTLLAVTPDTTDTHPSTVARLDAQRALVHVVDQLTAEDSLVHEAAAFGMLSNDTYERLVRAGAGLSIWEERFLDAAPEAQTDAFTRAVQATLGPEGDRAPSRLRAAGPETEVAEQTGEWAAAVDGTLDHLGTVNWDGADEVRDMTRDAHQAAGRQRLAALGWLSAALVFALGLSLALWRLVLRPVNSTTAETRRAATTTEQALASGDLSNVTVIPQQTDRELATITRSVRSLQLMSAALIKERSQPAGDDSEVYLHFGRRAQNLVTRQLNQIDGLEARTEDPDFLAELFTLDHLTTRLRRTAESMVLLAGSDSPRPWSRPISATNVIRAATAETADYSRVNLGHVDDAAVSGAVATEVSHLLAELIDNGLAQSPPESRTVLTGERHPDGSYVIGISNVGPGLPPDQLTEANRLLAEAEPPPAGGNTALPFGLHVAGCLAAPHDVRIKLMPAPLSRVRAEVTLPRPLMVLPTGAHAGAPVTREPRLGASAN
jgi:hypothetical protein